MYQHEAPLALGDRGPAGPRGDGGRRRAPRWRGRACPPRSRRDRRRSRRSPCGSRRARPRRGTSPRANGPRRRRARSTPARPRRVTWRSATSSSRSLRERPAPPGAANPLIDPPSARTDANARNPVLAKTSPRSASSMPYRRSGLSEPYRASISSYVIRGNGVGTSTPLSSRTSSRVERLDHREDVLLVDEGHLDVELRELEAAVRAGCLVAQAPHDLVVAVLSGHHQELLELLRRLRERVERPGPQPARARGSRGRPRGCSA